MMMSISYSDELEQFYKSDFYFSYSSINKLLYSPAAFYKHYILNQREDSVDAHLVAGKVVHCLLLEPDKFNDEFIVIPSNLPKDNNRLLVNEIFKVYQSQPDTDLTLADFPDSIISVLAGINLHQSLKNDEGRIAKMLTEQNVQYFEFLKVKQGKTIVDQATLDTAKESVELLRQHETVRSLLQLDNDKDENVKIYNEEGVQLKSSKYKFGFKGILDNVVMDYNTKTIFINDLKTTGKAIQDFPDSVQYYKYWIQAVMYKQLSLGKYLKGLPDAAEWKVVITFIVIDRANLIYPFQVSDETLKVWEESFKEILNVVDYHYSNKDFTLPYELATGKIKL
jgi:hypothetical protein